MDLVTGGVSGDDPQWFSMVCGEIRHLRAREVVLRLWSCQNRKSVCLWPDESLVVTCRDGARRCSLLGDQLGELERKRLETSPVCPPDTNEEVRPPQKAHHYEICDFLQMDFATKASGVLIWQRMRGLGRNTGSLYWYLDETKTGHGRQFVCGPWTPRNPLVDLKRIESARTSFRSLWIISLNGAIWPRQVSKGSTETLNV